MLPDRMRGVYNGADIANVVINKLHEDRLIFARTHHKEFPPELLFRAFAFYAGRLALDLWTDQGTTHHVFLAGVEEPNKLVLFPDYTPEEARTYAISDRPAPLHSMHGDIQFTLEATPPKS